MKKIIFIVTMFVLAISVHARAFDVGTLVNSAVNAAPKIAAAAKDITPAEEHYIGRAVCAQILSIYPVYNNGPLTKYVNEIGLLLAHDSERPETYGGYHFAVLNSDEPNAYACPGGTILINKGLIKQAKNEDQLAGILAHEVAHVAKRHGINAIKKSRWTDVGMYAAGEVAKNAAGTSADLVNAFGGVVTDVTKKVMESGYSQSDEKKADAAAVNYLVAVGYNPEEMVEFVRAEGAPAQKGPFKSHPKKESRVKALESDVKKAGGPGKTESVRTNRFKFTAK